MDNYRSVLFSRPEMGRDEIVWSVRFRRARRTIVHRAAKSGAEKAKTLNSKRESVRIPDTWARGEIKKNAEAPKIVTSPYKCTAEAILGGKKSG